MGVPTRGELLSMLMEDIRHAQEHSAMLAHHDGQNGYATKARMWIQVSENFKRTIQVVTSIATRGLQ